MLVQLLDATGATPSGSGYRLRVERVGGKSVVADWPGVPANALAIDGTLATLGFEFEYDDEGEQQVPLPSWRLTVATTVQPDTVLATLVVTDVALQSRIARAAGRPVTLTLRIP